jgi:hypothetical protein
MTVVNDFAIAEIVSHTIVAKAVIDPVKVTAHGIDFEVTHVRVELDWWPTEDGQTDDGWNASVAVYGWPLNSRGARDKRVKRAERIVCPTYPSVVHTAARTAFGAAVDEGRIDSRMVLGDDGRAGTVLTLL